MSDDKPIVGRITQLSDDEKKEARRFIDIRVAQIIAKQSAQKTPAQLRAENERLAAQVKEARAAIEALLPHTASMSFGELDSCLAAEELARAWLTANPEEKP